MLTNDMSIELSLFIYLDVLAIVRCLRTCLDVLYILYSLLYYSVYLLSITYSMVYSPYTSIQFVYTFQPEC